MRVPALSTRPACSRANATAERSGGRDDTAPPTTTTRTARRAVTDDALVRHAAQRDVLRHDAPSTGSRRFAAARGRSYVDDDELDGVDHWHAIETAAAAGRAARRHRARRRRRRRRRRLYAKRNELVLDVSESDTVALRVGDWGCCARVRRRARDDDADGVGNHAGSSCGNLTKADYLFDLKTDPFETRNLAREVAHNSTLRMLSTARCRSRRSRSSGATTARTCSAA